MKAVSRQFLMLSMDVNKMILSEVAVVPPANRKAWQRATSRRRWSIWPFETRCVDGGARLARTTAARSVPGASVRPEAALCQHQV